MSFTFQKNDPITFKHDTALLAKAEENRPEMQYAKIKPLRIVDIVQDRTKLQGYGTAESEKKPDSLCGALSDQH